MPNLEGITPWKNNHKIRWTSTPSPVLSLDDHVDSSEISPNPGPDIILMDLRMPVLDGFDAIALLKDNSKTKDIPILALSAQSMEDDDASAIIQLGDEGFISKPIDLNKLQREMARIFSLKKNMAT